MNSPKEVWLDLSQLRFIQQIGAGGFAVVWLAECLGTRVAVKIFCPAPRYGRSAPFFEAMFLREAALCAKQSHSNLVAYRGLARLRPGTLPGLASSSWAILSDFCDGGSLRDLLVGRALTWLLDVAAALAFLHGSSPTVIHRDVKAENQVDPSRPVMLRAKQSAVALPSEEAGTPEVAGLAAAAGHGGECQCDSSPDPHGGVGAGVQQRGERGSQQHPSQPCQQPHHHNHHHHDPALPHNSRLPVRVISSRSIGQQPPQLTTAAAGRMSTAGSSVGREKSSALPDIAESESSIVMAATGAAGGSAATAAAASFGDRLEKLSEASIGSSVAGDGSASGAGCGGSGGGDLLAPQARSLESSVFADGPHDAAGWCEAALHEMQEQQEQQRQEPPLIVMLVQPGSSFPQLAASGVMTAAGDARQGDAKEGGRGGDMAAADSGRGSTLLAAGGGSGLQPSDDGQAAAAAADALGTGPHFGVLAYEMLTGQLLIQAFFGRGGSGGGAGMQWAMQKPADYARMVSEGFRPPRPHHLSDAQWELVCRCWHQDPCERPPMAEVAAALNHMISELIEASASERLVAETLTAAAASGRWGRAAKSTAANGRTSRATPARQSGGQTARDPHSSSGGSGAAAGTAGVAGSPTPRKESTALDGSGTPACGCGCVIC
eukprot:XP_001694242.1 predicted protein [Chlamydomonas reinhardtii]